MSVCRRVRLLLVILVVCLLGTALPAQQGTVEEVITQGLFRMSRESFLEAFGIRPGDPYDEAKIVRAFRGLWEMGLFQDITIEAEDGPAGGKVLIVKLVERPILNSVSYQDNKVLNRTQIEDRLVEDDKELELGRPLDRKRIFAVEGMIRQLLSEKGFLDAQVKAETREITETSYAVHFKIAPGGKTRVKQINFIGNEVFKDRALRKQLNLLQPRKWYWPWSGKNLYHPVKWDQDSGAIRELYQGDGYLDVQVRTPVIDRPEPKSKRKRKKAADETGAAGPAETAGEEVPAEEAISRKAVKKAVKVEQRVDRLAEKVRTLEQAEAPERLPPAKEDKWYARQQKKIDKAQSALSKARIKAESLRDPKELPGRWITMTVPIVEGAQYRMGRLTIEGNTVFPDELVRALIPLGEDSVLSSQLLKIGIDRITRIYSDRGHLYANVVRQIERREGELVADVLVEIEEDKPYTVDTIEFLGNTSTQDKVVRREFRLREGQLFSQSALDLSVRKVRQLGYVEPVGEPVIEPVEGEDKVRVNVELDEKGRNEIQIGGGYSGLDGAFFTGFYSTRNFLGRGQVLSTSIQVGGRSNRYSVSFVEPWFLGRPYTFGFSLFRRDVDFGGTLTSSGEGGGLIFGRQIGNFSQFQTNYNFERVTSTGFTVVGGEAESRISSITPAYTINKVNNPFRPSRGQTLQAQFQYAGGGLGGNTSFYKPVLRYTGYYKGFRRSFFALHAEAGMVRSFGEGTTASTATVEGIPRFQRFWIGGEQQGPRIFDTRTITPLRFVRIDDEGRILEAVRDPRGRPVSDFDRNGDGVLNRFDLIELGGDRYYLVQAEWVYPVSEQLDVALFLDTGNAMLEDTPFGFDDVRLSAGVEVRFHLPVFPVPLRLIYGKAIKKLPEDSTSNFTFSLGRSF